MRWRIARMCLVFSLAVLLSACLASVIGGGHGYLLVRRSESEFAAVADDDEVYQRFDDAVWADPALSHLRKLFDGATQALIAEAMSTPSPQTVANSLCIALDSQETGVLHRVRVGQGRLELVLGLGHAGQEDLAWARAQMAPHLGLLLYELMGQRPAAAQTLAPPEEASDPAAALQQGLALAFATLTLPEESADPLTAEVAVFEQMRRQQAAWVEANVYLQRFAGGQPTGQVRSRDEALATPGVAATFFLRLMREAQGGYPTRHMLWFANFDAADVPYAKVLLALARMPRHAPSLERFVSAYQETFPAERVWIATLANEVWGAAARE